VYIHTYLHILCTHTHTHTHTHYIGVPARPLILCDARTLHSEALVNFSQKSPKDTAREAVTDLQSARFDPGAQVWCTYAGDAAPPRERGGEALGYWTSNTAAVFHSTRTLHAASPYPGEELTGVAFALLRELFRRAQGAAHHEASTPTSEVDKTVEEWATSVPPELFSGLQLLARRGEDIPPAVRASAADLHSALGTLAGGTQAEHRRLHAPTHRELATWLETVLERNMRRSVDARMVALDPCRLIHKLWAALFMPLSVGAIIGAVGSVVCEAAPLGWRQMVMPVAAWLLSAFSLFPFDDCVVYVAGAGTTATLAGVQLLLLA